MRGVAFTVASVSSTSGGRKELGQIFRVVPGEEGAQQVTSGRYNWSLRDISPDGEWKVFGGIANIVDAR